MSDEETPRGYALQWVEGMRPDDLDDVTESSEDE